MHIPRDFEFCTYFDRFCVWKFCEVNPQFLFFDYALIIYLYILRISIHIDKLFITKDYYRIKLGNKH